MRIVHFIDLLLGGLTVFVVKKTHTELISEPNDACYRPYDAMSYIGTVDVTSSGRSCLPWTLFDHMKFPEDSVGDARNYCRNPDSRSRPWCFVSYFWGNYPSYCDLPVCDGAPGSGEDLLDGFTENYQPIALPSGDGGRAAVFDPLNSTCDSINASTLQRTVEHIVLEEEYDATLDLWLSGSGLVCPTEECSDDYPTQVFQQGRDEGFCVPNAPLCLGASPCPMVSSTFNSSGDWTTCHFRCDCPPSVSPVLNLCSKLVVMMGNGSVTSGRETLELCDITVVAV